MFRFEGALIAALLEHGLAVDDQDLALAFGGLGGPKDEDGCRQASAIEQVGRQPDDGFDEVDVEEGSSDACLRALPEQCALRQDDSDAPGLRGHGGVHLLDPSPVAVLARRGAAEGAAAPPVAWPDVLAPLLQ